MSPGIFALLLVAVPLLLAVVPAVRANCSHTLFPADFGLVVLPAPAFFLALLVFNKPAQTGWAGIAYPFLILWLSVLTLYIRVFVGPRLGLNIRSVALGTFLLALLASVVFGAYVPPYYE